MFSSLGVGYMIKREEKCVCKYNGEKKLVMMRSFFFCWTALIFFWRERKM